MGTNYYAVKKKPSIDRAIHIGKLSWGWLFCFQDSEYFHTYPQFKQFVEEKINTGEYVIIDEYDCEIQPYDFIKMIDKTQKDPHRLKNPENFMHHVKNIDGYRFLDGDFT